MGDTAAREEQAKWTRSAVTASSLSICGLGMSLHIGHWKECHDLKVGLSQHLFEM